MCSYRLMGLFLIVTLVTGCGDNLLPSGEDKRPLVQAGTTGSAVGQMAPAFTIPDIAGNNVTLADALTGKQGIVLYFTMWCPICDTHMSHITSAILPDFPNVAFYFVDYVSGSVSSAANAAAASGYTSGNVVILADVAHQLTSLYQGTMGTAIVIDRTGIIRMNEDFRDGFRLQSLLSTLQ